MNFIITLFIASAISPEFEREVLRWAGSICGASFIIASVWLLTGWING